MWLCVYEYKCPLRPEAWNSMEPNIQMVVSRLTQGAGNGTKSCRIAAWALSQIFISLLKILQ